jgi:transposase
VGEYVRRFQVSGLGWPLPPEVTDEELDRKLFPGEIRGRKDQEPDWAFVHRELRRKDAHVTLALVWEEYRAVHKDGYAYSWFCEKFHEYLGRIEPVMRQTHQFGRVAFVDYAGDTVPILDPSTGEVREAQVFLGVLGGSCYTFSEACWSQDSPSWLTSHVNMMAYFGGCPKILVPDNLKSGVKSPDYYDPEINPAYQEFANHYKCAVMPTRTRKPKDKAKVENGVLHAERQILARLRDETFYGLAELNEAIDVLLDALNDRPFQKLPGSRKSMFLESERPALLPLPETPFEISERKKARVNIDYHVEVDGNYYSVPYTLLKELTDIRLTFTTIEVFLNGVRVASHRRSYAKGIAVTVLEHMPSHHRFQTEWNAERIISWASQVGPNTALIAESIMAQRQVPEQGFRSCLGLMRLSKSYDATRFEAACLRALTLGAFSRKSVQSILQKGLDSQPLPYPQPAVPPPRLHDNVRGPGYYT